MVTLVAIDPGHFHAALVQKNSLPGVSPVAYVFAPHGAELDAHLHLVEGFNKRAGSPTDWRENVSWGDDFLERFKVWAKRGALGEKPVVVLAGKNDRKSAYALAAVEAGCHVLADKPLAISPETFALTEKAARLAEARGLQFADMMTERHCALNQIRRELAADRALYGVQEPGSPEEPSVALSSVHHFCKFVDGKPLRRPAWYYDTSAQGEGIVDVTTHLVDQILWTLFPGVRLSEGEGEVLAADTWPTVLSPDEFELSTGCPRSEPVAVESNGAFTWRLRGICCKVSVAWRFKAPEGAGDTHASLLRGTKAELLVRQGATEGFRPVLYVRARADAAETAAALDAAIERLSGRWPGVAAAQTGAQGLWRIDIPEGLDSGHEGHFSQVVNDFLRRVEAEGVDRCETDNLLVKHRTLVEARRMAHEINAHGN